MMAILRRALTRIFAGCVALIVLVGCTSGGAVVNSDGTTSIVLTSQANETGFAQWLANELGYFADHGLNVRIEYAESGAAGLAAGAAGDWQAGWTGSPPAITGWDTWGLIPVGAQLKEDQNLVLFMDAAALENATPAEVLASNPVATVANSTSAQMLQACAAKLGVSQPDLEIIPLDPPAIVNALQSGNLKAGTAFSSLNFPLIQDPDKYVQVCDGKQAGVSIIDPYVVTPEFVNSHHDAAVGFVEATFRANEFIKANPEKAIDYLLEFYADVGIEGGRPKAELALEAREWQSLDEALAEMEDGSTAASLEATAQFFVDSGSYLEQPDLQAAVQAGIPVLRAAKKLRQ